MENIITFTDEITGVEHINIIKDDGSIIGMTKAEYDRQQAEQSTPILPE
jgi:predicted RNA-binding protein with PUA domain